MVAPLLSYFVMACSNASVTPKERSAMVLLVVLGALIGLGTMMKAWMDRRFGATAQPVVFSGGSEHWDQNEVPISMQCGACHEKEFRQWAGSDHAWAFRKLGDQWESEAFHNMKLDAHGSILQFSTNGHGRMVRDGQSSTSWRAEWRKYSAISYALHQGTFTSGSIVLDMPST